MATSSGQKGHDVRTRLLNEGCKFNFFQAVTLLERLEGNSSNEHIRFQPDASLSFPSSDIKGIKLARSPISGKERYLMTVTFMGLYGVNAPIPVYFTELISSPEADSEPLQDFLDIFNHRLISLFYRAWKKYRYHLAFQVGGTDPLSNHLLALSGLNSEEIARATGLPVTRLIRYTGILSMRSRTATGLRNLLTDFFGGIIVRIREFVPQWRDIPEAYQNRLGRENSRLGVNLSLGSQVLNRSGKIRIIIGPISLVQYESLLPNSEGFRTLVQLVVMYVSHWLQFDVEFIVKGKDIPLLRLSTAGTARLGFTAWLVSQQREDASVVFEV